MGKKYPRHARNLDVAAPLDPRGFADLLFRGVGGRWVGELSSAFSREGYAPFKRECDPSAYSCADSFRRDYLLGVMWSKYDDGKSSVQKATKALEKFHLAEDRCSDTNWRLYNRIDERLVNLPSARDVLYVARRKICRLLGPFDWNEAATGFGFGPGATTRLRRDRSTLVHKISGRPETTSNNADLARTVLRYNRLWEELALSEQGGEEPLRVVRANRVVTVPKNSETDRVIAIEPDMNIFVQKGIGTMIRRRLRRVGIDLNDQTVNQRLAYQGSLSGDLATLDLSMASDTVSKSIVEELIPADWLSALEQTRSPFGVLPCGKEILYRKFSSMGNGYTFELESLIFWALCSAVLDLIGERDFVLGVYGDDLVVPVGAVPDITRLLEYCGFSLNHEKSFSDGPFRESCGKHYFGGHDVTPFFVRHQPRRLSDAFLIHNNVVRWSDKGSHRDSGVDGMVERFCREARNAVPANWRKPRIPLGYGDGAFVGSFDECVPQRYGRGFEGFRASVLVQQQLDVDKKTEFQNLGPVAASLFLLERRKETEGGSGCDRSPVLAGNTYELRVLRPDPEHWAGISTSRGNPGATKVVTRPRIVKILVRQWAELGPWY